MMSKTAAEPLVRISKREGTTFVQKVLVRAIAILLALVVDAFFIFFVTGLNPISVYGVMWNGTFMNTTRFSWALRDLSSLLCIAIALAPAFKMRFWNIVGEGQFILGAVAATTVAFKLGPVLPSAMTLILMCLAGMLAAGIYGAIVAVLKVKFGTNETLMTLMLNYVALYFVTFLGETQAEWNFYLDKSSVRPIFATFSQYVSFPRIPFGKFGLNVCVIFTFLIGILVYVYLKYTKHGYEIAVIGESENTARYAGMNVGWVIMRTMFLSGAIAGVVGFLLVSGANNTLYSGVAAGAGFTAITVAWLAQLNPFAMVGISALLAVLQKGADTLNTQMGIPASLSDVITGVLLFFMLGCEFFINYKLVFRGAEERHKRKEAAK